MATKRKQELLEEAEYHSAVEAIDPSLVQRSANAIRTHLAKQGDLRSQAIADYLIAT